MQLTVVEGLTIPRGTACLGAAALAALECAPGDVIEIVGGGTTVAEAQPWSLDADSSTLGAPAARAPGSEQTIAMEGLVRQNARAALGDVVRVRRVRAQPAISAALVPLSGAANLSEAELRHVASSLRGR